VVQCFAMCCSVLRCVAVCCGVMQFGRVKRDSRSLIYPVCAVCCSVLQCVAVYCSVLQCAAVRCNMGVSNVTATLAYTQCVAMCYNVLQCVAACCDVWQYGHIKRVSHSLIYHPSLSTPLPSPPSLYMYTVIYKSHSIKRVRGTNYSHS